MGNQIHHPLFYFTDSSNTMDGGPWGNYSSTFTRSDVPSAWTCHALFYGSKDGCDCECGAWDPDCDADAVSAQQIFNCDTSDLDARCSMSLNSPVRPVCLYDRMAADAANDAGFSSPTPTVSTAVIIAASVGSTVGVFVFVAAIALFIRHRRVRRASNQGSLSQSFVPFVQRTFEPEG